MEAGDAGHGVVDAVAFEPAIAEDLPDLRAGDGVPVVRPTAALVPDSSHAVQSLQLPGRGRPTATSRESASMTTWRLVKYR